MSFSKIEGFDYDGISRMLSMFECEVTVVERLEHVASDSCGVVRYSIIKELWIAPAPLLHEYRVVVVTLLVEWRIV